MGGVSLSRVLGVCPLGSRWQQDKVVIDIDHGHVEGGHFVDAQGLVGRRVQFLHLQLPLHALDCVQRRSLVLLPHQQARLGRGKGAGVTTKTASHLIRSYKGTVAFCSLLIGSNSVKAHV